MRTSVLLFYLFTSSVWISVSAQDYVGSDECGECHESKYLGWAESGHHFSMIGIDGAAPDFPFQYHSGQPNIPAPPTANGTQLDWNDITYVVGGYYRHALFTDTDGYLITGQTQETTEWLVWDQDWTPYHPGEELSLDCAACHATGYNDTGHQGELPGVEGTWAEDGVGCEACHGPDS